ncbi:PAS and ANTAR domain-containing protein [Mycobacterium sp. IDR2000157661]|nr:PAS and ANTAR domain-containing protein [Mycobacterium sp. IDR2000157661]
MEGFAPESDTGTDGVAPGPLDKALLGGLPQRVGRFEYRYDTDTWTWSDTVARIHGYEPGEVEPTTELVLSHKHPDDLELIKGLLNRSSAPFAGRHRIITNSGKTRRVVVVGEIVTDSSGEVEATRGFYIDVTAAVEQDVQDSIGHKLDDIVAHRAVIEQAKGMLMLAYDIDSDAAFDVLRWRSQELNIKLNEVAKTLVEEMPRLSDMRAKPGSRIDHFLLTLENEHTCRGRNALDG